MLCQILWCAQIHGEMWVSSWWKDSWSGNTNCTWSACNRSSDVAQISKICAPRYRTWFNFLNGFGKSVYALTMGFGKVFCECLLCDLCTGRLVHWLVREGSVRLLLAEAVCELLGQHLYPDSLSEDCLSVFVRQCKGPVLSLGDLV